ncbi:hypothetical protein P280DRAFT_441000 [Massarina eburnea CBS 473.64]|uniref:Peptidase A1 domain-containing protein n=1 Tax=Massarina eburnea CBS 473.64 TaxID=1395130 RepID=A0A6A6SI81_9PLEO|nr:hypothetical protein P280DRAFT_441000 [Massarina eburnea CBS 473.64]
MSSPILVLGAAAVLFAQSTVAFNCSKAPIYVDIHKRAVHDSPVFQYGSFIGVGTPAQNHSLWPSLSRNQTSFASLNYCGNSTLRNCDTSTGGFFQPEDSTSFSVTNTRTLDAANGTTKAFLGEDTLRLYTHYFETDGAWQTLLEKSSVKVAEQGSTTPSVVGIGSSSTVLRDLAARDIIAGKTYSLYIGQGFDRAGGLVNGSNVFGGYDSGRFTGPVHKYNMDLTKMNPMSVRVKDIVLTETANPNSNTSLFDPTAFPSMTSRPDAFTAEITTDQYPLSLPYQITQNFIKQLGASADNTWNDNSLKLKNGFNGTLSIVLEDGFTVTLPAEVLANQSNITPIQDRAKDSKQPFYLSVAFLTQVYLMADYESSVFYLAEAIQKNNAVMPVAFCPRSTPAPYERPNQGAWAKQGLVGAVVGGVIGGIGIAICAYCFVLGCRRKMGEKRKEKALEKGRRAKIEQMEIEEAGMFFDPPPKTAKPFFWRKR